MIPSAMKFVYIKSFKGGDKIHAYHNHHELGFLEICFKHWFVGSIIRRFIHYGKRKCK